MMMSKSFGVLKCAAAALAVTIALPMTATPAAADARSDSNDAYVQGFRLFQAGDFRTARIQFLKALKANPNNGLARLMQARIALEFGAGVQAQTELERAVQAGIPADKVRHLRAHALLLQRKYGEAQDLLDPRTIPPQFAAYAARLRGRILAQQSKLPEARAEFESARGMAPNDPDTLVDVARFYASDGKPNEALALADQVLAAKPTNSKALLMKGDLVRRSQGLAPSLTYFNRALEVDPNNIEALLERAATLGDLKREPQARADLKRINDLVPDHPLALYLEAVLEARARQYEKARNLMTRTKGALDSYAPALMLQGMLAYQANDIGQATTYFGKVVGGAPQSVLARKLYAAAQLRGNDVRGAIDTLKPVIDLGAADGRTYAIYGAAFARQGDMAKAQEYLQKAVNEAPKAGVLKTQLAMTQLLQGNADAAEDELLDVLKTDSKSLQALMVLTLIQLRDKQFDKALATSGRIVKLYPDIPVGYNIQGGAQLGLNEIKKAEASFRMALTKKPDYIEARRNLAQVLAATGRHAEAERELKTIIESNKRDVRALTLLASLAARRGDATGRLEWLRQAASADATKVGPRLQLTDAYLATNQSKRALDEISAVVRDFPDEPQALLMAARVYEATDQRGRMEFDAQPPRDPAARQHGAARPAGARTRGEQEDPGGASDLRTRNCDGEGQHGAHTRRAHFLRGAAERSRRRQEVGRPPAQTGAEVLRRRPCDGPRPSVAEETGRGDAVPRGGAAHQVRLAVARSIAEAQVQLGKPGQAIATLQSYQRANPRDAVALAAIAELQLNQKQYKAAIANYQALVKLTGGAAESDRAQQPRLGLFKGRRQARAGDGETGLRRRPIIAGVQDTYGWILLKSKTNPKQALGVLQRAAASRAERCGNSAIISGSRTRSTDSARGPSKRCGHRSSPLRSRAGRRRKRCSARSQG